MLDLSKPTEPVKMTPPTMIVYGEPGIGKSTFASNAPKAFFIDTENSLKYLREGIVSAGGRVERVRTYEQVLECIDALISQPHEFRTVVIDTLDWLEQMIHTKICAGAKAGSISDKFNDVVNFGKGHIIAANYAKEITDRLNRLNDERRMAVILTAHNVVKGVNDPDGDGYDRHTLKMHEKFASHFTEWADCVLYAKQDTVLGTSGKPLMGEKVFKTCETRGAVSKNRLFLPPKIPMSWAAFIDSINKNKPSKEEEQVTEAQTTGV
jgi:hypothetical protein